MKTSASHSEATAHGTAEREGAPRLVWKLRVVYGGSIGIVKGEPLHYGGEQPLGLGRRLGSAHSGWLTVPDERASRDHARISATAKGIVIEDLHSKNGSAVNGVRLRPGAPRLLHDGDVLRFADSFVVVRHEPEAVPDSPLASFVGVSQSACRIRHAIHHSTLHDRHVLLIGGSGTGKEAVAQAIHQQSHRRRNLVSVSCAAIPADVAAAQFFGSEKNAFGTSPALRGLLMDAHQGTLVLNDIGELPQLLQPQLVAALQSRQATPLGGRAPIPFDVRILATSPRDLTADVRNRTFREDLYALLAGETLELPPLRERREDILLLVQHFAGPTFWLSPRMAGSLLLHKFPHNVREIGQIIDALRSGSEQAVIDSLSAAQPSPLLRLVSFTDGDLAPTKATVPNPSSTQLAAMLAQYRGNLRRIEIERGYSRRQLHRWIDKFGLDLEAYRRG